MNARRALESATNRDIILYIVYNTQHSKSHQSYGWLLPNCPLWCPTHASTCSPCGSGMMCYGPLSGGSAPVLALLSVSSVPALRMATATKSASSMSGSSASSSELAATTDADRVRLISSCCARCTSGQGDLRLRDSAVLRFAAVPNEQVKPSSSKYLFSIPARVSVSHTGKWELCGEHETYLHGPACAS